MCPRVVRILSATDDFHYRIHRAMLSRVVLCVAVLAVLGAAQTVEDRAVAAIVGAFVADAAAMPLHWIYNVVRASNETQVYFIVSISVCVCFL